jgi:beta-lactamase superfamily II metal-dependent hydrolase
MRIEIFDVGHGQCAVMTSPNGQRMMIDCGTRWGEQRFWTPSLHYFRTAFALLSVTNLDEDHLSDFAFMMQHCTIPWIASNPTVGIHQFRLLKKDGMGPGARAFANWLTTLRPPNPFQQKSLQPDFGTVQVHWYWNAYQPSLIDTTNDLSVVVVVQYGLFKIVFAGDLEAQGWKNLLRNSNFVADIQSTAIFVASHHGRESGCCTNCLISCGRRS